MKETCTILNVSYETLKFYCKEGLVPNVARNASNHRVFDEANLAWLQGIMILRKCGMSLKDMKTYLEHCLIGQETIPERKIMLELVEQELHKRRIEIEDCLNYIDNKQNFYDKILNGELEYISNLIKTKKEKVS
jgi:DNA-binding transcriptional MerR regulator